MTVIRWVVVVILAVVVIDRVACWAERRGWIYWRRRRPYSSGGSALDGLFDVLDPARQVVRAEQDHRKMLPAEKSADEPGNRESWVDLTRRTAQIALTSAGSSSSGDATAAAASGTGPAATSAAAGSGARGPAEGRPGRFIRGGARSDVVEGALTARQWTGSRPAAAPDQAADAAPPAGRERDDVG